MSLKSVTVKGNSKSQNAELLKAMKTGKKGAGVVAIELYKDDHVDFHGMKEEILTIHREGNWPDQIIIDTPGIDVTITNKGVDPQDKGRAFKFVLEANGSAIDPIIIPR